MPHEVSVQVPSYCPTRYSILLTRGLGLPSLSSVPQLVPRLGYGGDEALMPHQVLINLFHGWHCWPEFHRYFVNQGGGWIEWLCRR